MSKFEKVLIPLSANLITDPGFNNLRNAAADIEEARNAFVSLSQNLLETPEGNRYASRLNLRHTETRLTTALNLATREINIELYKRGLLPKKHSLHKEFSDLLLNRSLTQSVGAPRHGFVGGG